MKHRREDLVNEDMVIASPSLIVKEVLSLSGVKGESREEFSVSTDVHYIYKSPVARMSLLIERSAA